VTSAVVLLVWLPHVTKQTALAGENTALRLLFPGNAPQHVVINALDKVKDFEILSSPVYKIRPAPEPVVHHAKKPVSAKPVAAATTTANGVKPVANGNGKSLTATTSKSNLASKPPMMAKSEAKPKSAEAKPAAAKPAPPKADKKPVSAPVAKKTEPSPAKKTEVKKAETAVKKAEPVQKRV